VKEFSLIGKIGWKESRINSGFQTISPDSLYEPEFYASLVTRHAHCGAKTFLKDYTEVVAVFQQVGGKRVVEGVTTDY